jgi:GTPase
VTPTPTPALVGDVLRGDVRAVARAISLVEDDRPEAPALLAALFPHAGKSLVVGVTGPPGAGKSTLVDRMTARLRAQGRTVGIVAVDPTSPFSGGAILGDRIRMQAHALDAGVFIRSMATRGSVGGLARATGEVIKLLLAFGHPWVLVETVGVGQTELDIMRLVDTTVVVLVPESGDAIQTMKAGLMEVADVFVVNKADRPGAPALMAELKFAAHLHATGTTALGDVEWEIPVLSCQAQADVGMAELLGEVRRHRGALEASGALEGRRRRRRRAELEALLVEEFRDRIARGLAGGALRAKLDEVETGEIDPYSAVAAMLPMVSLEPS